MKKITKQQALVFLTLFTIISCVNSNKEKQLLPKTVNILRDNKVISIEKFDMEKNLIEKINPTFYVYKLLDCESTDSTLRWLYSYSSGHLTKEVEIESCSGKIRKEESTLYTYNKKNQLKSEYKINSAGDTLSIILYDYIGNKRIETYHNLKQNYISKDTTILAENGEIAETRIKSENLEIIHFYEYNKEGLPIIWKMIYIKNKKDTVKNRLTKYVYDENGLLKELRILKRDKNNKQIEKPWIKYDYTFYD